MLTLVQIVGALPLPKSARLAWQRTLIDRSYRQDISSARLARNHQRAEKLEGQQRFELEMIQEEEDHLYTTRLLRNARRLRVPIPPLYGADSKLTGSWEESRNFGYYILTKHGIAQLREEIRKEIRWHNEQRAHWIAWAPAIVSVILALTTLVTAFFHR